MKPLTHEAPSGSPAPSVQSCLNAPSRVNFTLLEEAPLAFCQIHSLSIRTGRPTAPSITKKSGPKPVGYSPMMPPARGTWKSWMGWA